jgi:hypothetical protein
MKKVFNIFKKFNIEFHLSKDGYSTEFMILPIISISLFYKTNHKSNIETTTLFCGWLLFYFYITYNN